ncbi:uncharacterized protein JCM10292_001320 [Rhodotorula paludigena]|uniref:uncharacterized protein n=1 Tax=Rhodotorula paludigena TaxID=86838 RepID=UPI00317E3115
MHALLSLSREPCLLATAPRTPPAPPLPTQLSAFPPRAAKLAHKRVLTNHRRKPSGDASSGGLASTLPSFRLKIRHLLFALALFSLSLFYFTGGNSKGSTRRQSAAQRSLAELTVHCPFSTSRKHIPTVILQGTQAHDRHANRTVFVVDQPGDVPAPFLPYSYPPRDLRFAQTISPQNEALNHKEHHRPGMGRLHEGVHPDDESGSQLCKVYRVPSSPRPRLAGAFAHHKVMYGMSTTADRVLWNLPVWAQWLPGVPKPPLDPDDKGAVARLPLVLVLTPPTTASDSNRHRDAIEATERLRAREAEEEAAIHGMHIALRPRAAERFETRYFALAEEMWREAKTREEKEGVHTEWFVFADDDTFFPDVDALGRMLGSLDSHDDHLIGALSESTKQVNQWGHIAYGGAGIIVSRGLLAKMNQDGVWEHCLAKFGAAFGGDAMVSHCAALAMDMSVERALTIEPTMHQLDIRGDGTGFFQSGFLFTSIHHWGSWYTLFPPWTDAGVGDLRKGIVLVGKAAQAVGGDNWGRRYVFEDGKVIVALGYSITVEATPLTFDELNKSEHTWWEFETFHPIRPGQEEAVDKRTYYLSNVRQLDAAGIFRLEHKNREGERIDIIWDQRGPGGTNRWLAEKR